MPFRDSGQYSRATTTCRDCHRMVRVVKLGAELVACDPEMISVVQYGHTPPSAEPARRIHAERCQDYQAEAARAKTTAELKRYNARSPARAAAAAEPSPMSRGDQLYAERVRRRGSGL